MKNKYASLHEFLSSVRYIGPGGDLISPSDLQFPSDKLEVARKAMVVAADALAKATDEVRRCGEQSDVG
jgi:hypothetical protein